MFETNSLAQQDNPSIGTYPNTNSLPKNWELDGEQMGIIEQEIPQTISFRQTSMSGSSMVKNNEVELNARTVVQDTNEVSTSFFQMEPQIFLGKSNEVEINARAVDQDIQELMSGFQGKSDVEEFNANEVVQDIHESMSGSSKGKSDEVFGNKNFIDKSKILLVGSNKKFGYGSRQKELAVKYQHEYKGDRQGVMKKIYDQCLAEGYTFRYLKSGRPFEESIPI